MRHLAQTRDVLAAALLVGAFVTGCSDSSENDQTAVDSAGSPFDQGGGGTSGAADEPENDGEGGFETTGGGDDSGDESGGGESSGGDADDADPTPESGPFALCPEELPPGWIFCEDFEEHDPFDVFFDYVDGDGRFVRELDGGASGVGAMRASYQEGVEAAGFLSVSFGNNPINGSDRPGYAPESHFDEVYWRFRIKMQDGWPDVGPHNLSRVSSFAQSDWGQAMVAAVTSDGDGVPLRASAATCVQGGEVECKGVEDSAALQPLGALVGETPVFSAERAGRWQCIETHVKLNSLEQADGVFEFWVDGVPQGTAEGIDWRGSWDAFGLNLLSIENFWEGGAPANLDRWIDDLVISTEPIGCGEP